jgi:poly(3-hydroxybutyrate) depolymerase
MLLFAQASEGNPMNRLLLFVCALCSAIACVAAAAPDSVSMPPGLVSWWKANGNANDSAGPNNGTIQGGVKIDDIQYYNTALTAAQIRHLYKMP